MKKFINFAIGSIIILLIILLYISFNIERNIKLRHWLSDHFQNTEIQVSEPSVYFLGVNNVYKETATFNLENPDYINLQWLKDMDVTYHYDLNAEILSLMWQSNYLIVDKDGSTTLNGQKINLSVDYQFTNGSIYISIDDFSQLEGFRKLGFKSVRTEDNSITIILSDAVDYGFTSSKEKSYLFQSVSEIKETFLIKPYPTIKDVFTSLKILDSISPEDSLIVYDVNEDTVLAFNGRTIGYALKSVIQPQIQANTFIYQTEDYYEDKALVDEPIFLVWEAVYGRNPKTNQIPDMKGVNVVSPTWIELENSHGDISSQVSTEYIEWTKFNQYELWILATNDFDPDLTHEFLSSYKSRKRFIDNLITLCIENKIEGINIDFENIYIDDKDNLSHFINELAWYSNQFKLTLSMDVTVMDGSDNWSKCFDRRALGKAVDYLIIMTYDEYWASSPISGPVSSYDWVENSLTRILEEVPGRKLVMGLPFYTRVWTETFSNEAANKVEVSSNSIGMVAQNKLIEEKELAPIWNEQDGLFFVSYLEDNQIKKIWVENETTLAKKAGLVKKLGLRGVACWRRGLEENSVYDAILNEISE